MERHIINEKTVYPVQPKHINATKHFWDAFNDDETEISAGYIVRLCQRNQGWKPFTKEEIESLYQEVGHKNFTFNNLLKWKWIVEKYGRFYVTHEFVTNCFRSSPDIAAPPTEFPPIEL